jgi:hypothetical protein
MASARYVYAILARETPEPTQPVEQAQEDEGPPVQERALGGRETAAQILNTWYSRNQQAAPRITQRTTAQR